MTERAWAVSFVGALTALLALQMGNLGFSPILPSLQRDLGMSFTQLGLFTGLYGLLALVMSVPAGFSAQRFGEKRTLLFGTIGVVAGLVLLGRADDAGDALVSRGIWIAGYRFAFVSVLVAVAVTCPPTLKGRSMGIVGATSSLASIIGSPAGGALTREFGWRIGVLGYAGVTILAAVIFAILYRTRRAADIGPVGHTIAQGPLSNSAPSAFRTPIVWVLALVLGLGGVGQFSITYFVPSVARDVYGLDAVSAGLIISTGYAGAIVMNLLIGVLMDRYNKWTILAGIFSVHIVASLLMTVPHLPTFRLATAIVLALGFSAVNQLYGMAGEVMKGRQVGNVMGVVSLGAGVFGYVGPQLFGALRDLTGGFRAGFLAVAVADAITLSIILLLHRQ
ncbi:MAG: MFS transporter, partial [Vicinamibacterales bacterium]